MPEHGGDRDNDCFSVQTTAQGILNLIAGPHETIDIQPTNRLLLRRLPCNRAVLVGQGHGWSTAQEHNWPFNAPQLCAAILRAWIEGQPLPAELVAFS